MCVRCTKSPKYSSNREFSLDVCNNGSDPMIHNLNTVWKLYTES